MSDLKVRQGYRSWISEPARARSGEIDFGVWWKLYTDDPRGQPIQAQFGGQDVTILSASTMGRWRVSWIEDTGELYATQQNSDRFVVLGNYETRGAVEKRMEGWADRPSQVLTEWFPGIEEAKPLFELGQVVATPGALKALEDADQSPGGFLARHQTGEWGDLDEHDRKENELSLEKGFRLLSAYQTAKGKKIWIITEWDRSVTTILLPEDY